MALYLILRYKLPLHPRSQHNDKKPFWYRVLVKLYKKEERPMGNGVHGGNKFPLNGDWGDVNNTLPEEQKESVLSSLSFQNPENIEGPQVRLLSPKHTLGAERKLEVDRPLGSSSVDSTRDSANLSELESLDLSNLDFPRSSALMKAIIVITLLITAALIILIIIVSVLRKRTYVTL